MDRLPILPLGQVVVYPPVVLPMALSDPHAVQLIDEVVQGNKRLLLGIVKPLAGAEPPEGAVMQARPDELYEVGTLGSVVRMLKLGDGSVRVMVQGLERARFVEIGPAEHWLVAGFETLASAGPEDARTEALKRTVHAQFSRVIDIAPYLGEELHEVLSGITDGSKLADFAAANLDLALPAKAELLSIDDVNRRLERLAELLGQELQVLEVGTQIQEKVKSRLDANQREYVLREQLRVIRQELGEDDGDDELDELGRRLDEAGLHAEAKKVADRELKRLRQMSPQSAEYHVARTYLEVFATLPWRSVGCGTRRRCAAIAAPTSAPSRAASSTRCSAARRATPCSCSMRWTRWVPTSGATRRPRCSRCSILRRTPRSSTTTSRCRSISRASCSSPPRTASRRSPTPCSTGWRFSPYRGTLPARSSPSRSASCSRVSSRRRGSRRSARASPTRRWSG